jgi:hypothetical protein
MSWSASTRTRSRRRSRWRTARRRCLPTDGTYSLSVEYEQFGDPDGWQDNGTFQRHENGDLSFDSEAWGDHFAGEVDGDLVVLYYDFCTNGVADIDLVFEK